MPDARTDTPDEGVPPERGAIKPALRRAEAELAQHLEEACEDLESKDLSQESLDELLRLENELLAAARAAQQTVELRRKLGERPQADQTPTVAPSAGPMQAPDEAFVCRLREFRDASGAPWRVWEVKPGSSGRAANPERYLGEYFKGWLTFESLESDVRKRLPSFPSNWLDMPDAELAKLLPRAVEVPQRKRGAGSGAPTK